MDLPLPLISFYILVVVVVAPIEVYGVFRCRTSGLICLHHTRLVFRHFTRMDRVLTGLQLCVCGLVNLLALLTTKEVVENDRGGGEIGGGVDVVHRYRIARGHQNAIKTFIKLKIIFYFILDYSLVLQYTCPAGPGSVSP